jgi:hypothetical protein
LAHGIDVWLTLNVANIESMGEVVSRITGVHQSRAGADAFVRTGEVTLVDLAPAALRYRLAEGSRRPGRAGRCSIVDLFPLREPSVACGSCSSGSMIQFPIQLRLLAARGISGPVNASVIVVGLEGVARRRMAHPLRRPSRRAVRCQAPRVHVRAIDNLDQPPKARLDDRQLLSNRAELCADQGRPLLPG